MYQSITIAGHLGGDVELRYTPSGVPVATFSIATSRKFQNANGEPQEKTVWFRISAWRKQAETASQYLHKGSKVLIVGEVEEARPFTDKSGTNRASLEVTANTIRFLDSKSASTSDSAASETQDTTGDGEQIPF